MTISLHNSAKRRDQTSGFTLVELIIAATLGTMVLAGVLSCFLLLVRSGVRVSNYSTMETQTRRAFEQLGIDARMANGFLSDRSSGAISSFTLAVPDINNKNYRTVTYGYETDPTDSTKKQFFYVPGSSATATTGKIVLIGKISNVAFARYDKDDVLIGISSNDTAVKHIQVQVSVKRTGVGVADSTQVIRSSAFTIRNISI